MVERASQRIPAADSAAAGARGPEGLLDTPERAPAVVDLQTEPEAGAAYAPGTFRKVASGMVVLVGLMLAPYLLPEQDAALARRFSTCPEGTDGERPRDCSFARAWLPGEPVPFWNLVGREWLGEGEGEAQAEAEVAEVAELAQSLLARDAADAPPPVVRPIRPPPPPMGEAPESSPPYVAHPDDALKVPQPLEMPSPQALDPFFEALARTELGYEGATTRVSQWGDSVMSNDNVTSALRTTMQRRFGDAGHGFHLLARPNNSYRHRGVRFKASDWELCYIINKCKSDAHFGFGGTTVWSFGGAQSVFRTVDDGAFGRTWSRVELWYAAQPGGGRIRIEVDDDDPVFVSTRGGALEDRWQTIVMEDGPHRVKIRAGRDGRVRLYGVVLERDVPGVVWDGMEQLGAFTNRMLHFDPEHLRRQVDHRDPDLLVFMFGGNDLTLSARNLAKYEDTWRDALALFRGSSQREGARSERPCLLIAPVDHGQRKGQQILSVPGVAEVVARQRRAAQAAGCAFFDTPAAMGGDGSAGRWRKTETPLIAGDLAHLTNAGQKVIGHYVYLALMQQYVAYRERTADSGGP